MAPGPALLLVGDLSGLHVFEALDAAGVLARILAGEAPKDLAIEARGICAFVPIPFGSGDVLRVVRAVGVFDGRRRDPASAGEQKSEHESREGLHDVRG